MGGLPGADRQDGTGEAPQPGEGAEPAAAAAASGGLRLLAPAYAVESVQTGELVATPSPPAML